MCFFFLFRQFAEEATNLMPDSKTVVYREAVEHASKLLRMIRIKKRHLVLVGETGSGRQTICDLTTRMLNYKTVYKASQTAIQQVENTCLSLNFATAESEDAVDKKIGHIFNLASKKRVICLVLADDANFLNNYFLEFLNSFIVNDSISGFLSPNMYNEPNVIQAIQSNLNFVLCLPMNRNSYRYLSNIRNAVLKKDINLLFFYRNLLNKYTSLLTNTTTNCIHPLAEISLMEVAKHFFKSRIVFDVPILSQENIKDHIEPVVRLPLVTLTNFISIILFV